MKHIQIVLVFFTITIFHPIFSIVPLAKNTLSSMTHLTHTLKTTQPAIFDSLQKRALSRTSKQEPLNLPYVQVAEEIKNQWGHKIDPTIDIRKIAWPIQQNSPEEIHAILQKSEKHAQKFQRKKITMSDFLEGVAEILHGPQDASIQKDVRPEVAIHEAGHILTELVYPADHIMVRATVNNHEKFEGSVIRINCLNHGFDIPVQCTIHAMMSRLGGSIAEQVTGLNGPTTMLKRPEDIEQFLLTRTAQNDTEKYVFYLSELTQKYKLNENDVLNIVRQTYQDTYNFLDKEKKGLKKIANILTEEKTIYEDRIYSLFPDTSKPLYRFEQEKSS